jgi:hypothetical protein
MNTKLTLNLSRHIIQKAKDYASKHKTSISRMVESYLQSLTSEDKESDIEISPFVKSLSEGGEDIPADFDYRKEYTNYLVEKYK